MGFFSNLFRGRGKQIVRRHVSKVEKMRAWGAMVKPGSNPNYVPRNKRPK